MTNARASTLFLGFFQAVDETNVSIDNAKAAPEKQEANTSLL